MSEETMKRYERYCPNFGKLFQTEIKRQKYCCKKCMRQAMNGKKIKYYTGQKEKVNERTRRIIKERSETADINQKAREKGMSYGQYIAWLSFQESGNKESNK